MWTAGRNQSREKRVLRWWTRLLVVSWSAQNWLRSTEHRQVKFTITEYATRRTG